MATVRIDDSYTRRWRWIATFALISALLWTAVLAMLLFPRSLDRTNVAQPAAPAATTVARTNGDAPLTPRPRSYSPIDTQTLAAARLREDIQAGRSVPAIDDAKQVVGLESKAATNAAPTVSIVEPAPAASVAAPAPPPAVAQRDRMEVPANPEVALARVSSPRPAMPRVELTPLPETRVALPELRRDARRDTVASAQSRVPDESRVADARATLTRASPDARSAELDARWERREQWLRERLQSR